MPSDNAKLAVFDEAHKYLQNSTMDELSGTIVSTVRQMRHNGVRVVVSTQSPKTLPPELLELVSVTSRMNRAGLVSLGLHLVRTGATTCVAPVSLRRSEKYKKR